MYGRRVACYVPAVIRFVVVLMVAVSSMAQAVDDPAAPCATAELVAIGTGLAERLRCEARAARTGGAPPRRCVLRTNRRFATALADADAIGGCLRVGDADVFTAELDAFIVETRALVRDGRRPSRCARRALLALGARGQAVLAARAQDLVTPDAVTLGTALATAEATFEAAMAAAVARGGCAPGADAAALASAQDDLAERLRTIALPPLRALAAGTGRRIGAAVQSGFIAREADYVTTLAREFDAITAEFEALWFVLHPMPDVFDFTALDNLASFAEAHGMVLRGHHLVWPQPAYIPDWVEALPPDELRAELERYIRTVVGHFKGRMATWVVVNEAVGLGGGLSSGLWLDQLGPGYIADAFRIAHEADPDAELIYNDFFADGINAKSDFIYAMVQELLADGVPIHGVGFQMHHVFGPLTPTLPQNLQRFSDLGLRVQLTEMDVQTQGFPGDLAARLEVQRGIYHDAVAACLAVERCEAVTFWGFTDKHSWIDLFFQPNTYPLPFDRDYRPKPAYFGIRDALLGR